MVSSTPMKNQIGIPEPRIIVLPSLSAFARFFRAAAESIPYQKMMLSAAKITTATIAQVHSRLYHGAGSSAGSFVAPYTRPSNSVTGRGLVSALVSKITMAVNRNAHKARNTFSAIGLASGESATVARAAGLNLTHMNRLA